MSSAHQTLGVFSNRNLGEVDDKRFAIVVAEWNEEVTGRLYNGALSTLLNEGVKESNVVRKEVPGSFELSLGAQYMAQWKEIDAVICLGCVVRGETPHFDYICQAIAYGLTEVGLKYNKPVVFGVLTTDSHEQAMERAGGKFGNKGSEAAITAIKMLNF
jgi:6,7-dimethyl-8-ribityllumazine synthase